MSRFATFMLLLVMFAFVAPAAAGIIYCKNDPVVQLNGTLVDISIGIPVEYVPLVTGPVRYTIQTPSVVERNVILTDVGYGHGVDVIFTDGAGAVQDNAFPVRITVSLPIDESQLGPDEVVPVELTVHPLNAAPVTVTGTSNHTTMRLSVQGQ